MISCTSAPDLPEGLHVNVTPDGQSCSLSGIPQNISDTKKYEITGQNTAGKDSIIISLSVETVPELPKLINSAQHTLIKNGESVSLLLSNQGGKPEVCKISPNLPKGLKILAAKEDGTCVIEGVAEELSEEISYIVTAQNIKGTVETSLILSVSEAKPNLDSLGEVEFVQFEESTYSFKNTGGGNLTSCSADKVLPSWLSLQPTSDTCILIGTPLEPFDPTVYVLTGENAIGTSSASFTAVFAYALPQLVSPGNLTLILNKVIDNIIFSNTRGGGLTDCTAESIESGSLPAGLRFEVSGDDCILSGKPTEVMNAKTYKFTALNSAGSHTVNLDLSVEVGSPMLEEVPSKTYFQNVVIEPLLIKSTSGIVNECTHQGLPAGLTLSVDSENNGCLIQGTPTAVSSAANYMITAINENGEHSITINITVHSGVPELKDLSNLVFLVNQSVNVSFENIGGGSLTSCVPTDALPAGLSLLNTDTCTLTGTPTEVSAAKDYIITATNVTGSATAKVNITVNPAPPIINDGIEFTMYQTDSRKVYQIPNLGGGDITKCTITPDLSAGLAPAMGEDTCVIIANKPSPAIRKQYTATVENISGSDSGTIYITVLRTKPKFTREELVFILNQTKSVKLNSTGGDAITNCRTEPDLPAGLTINVFGGGESCAISGTPTEISSPVTYSVFGTNSAGEGLSYIDLSVIPSTPYFENPGTLSFSMNSQITYPLINIGGEFLTKCSSSGFPEGLTAHISGDRKTCVLTGKPVVTGTFSAVVSAENASGVSPDVSFNVVIQEATEPLTGESIEFVFLVNVDIGAEVIPNSGGSNITECTSDIALPTGITFDRDETNSNCVLTGTPSVPSIDKIYELTVTNSEGSSTTSAKIGINICSKDRPDGSNDPLLPNQWFYENTGQNAYAGMSGDSGKDLNIRAAHNYGCSGKGVSIMLIDDSLETNHPDLNIDSAKSYNIDDFGSDPSPVHSGDTHGTMVAGIINMQDNLLGGLGIAPGANVSGMNLLGKNSEGTLFTDNYSEEDFVSLAYLGEPASGSMSSSLFNNIDILNYSWGKDECSYFSRNDLDSAALSQSIRDGRDGKGRIYVYASGNGFSSISGCSCSAAVDNSVSCHNSNSGHLMGDSAELIVAGAFNAAGKVSSYSSRGSNLWILGSGGESGYQSDRVMAFNFGTGWIAEVYDDNKYMPAILSTDLQTCQKGNSRENVLTYSDFDYDLSPGTESGEYIYTQTVSLSDGLTPSQKYQFIGPHSDNLTCDYTSTMQGTSAAAPSISGLVALMLEANPDLTWRDIKHIFAITVLNISNDINLDYSDSTIDVNGTNLVIDDGWVENAVGNYFSNAYGFGVPNAQLLLEEAFKYTANSFGDYSTMKKTVNSDVGEVIPDFSASGLIKSLDFSDQNTVGFVENVRVQLNLTHPDVSELLVKIISPSGTESIVYWPFSSAVNTANFNDYSLTSNAFYGESSSGEWKIVFADVKETNEGQFLSAELEINGH